MFEHKDANRQQLADDYARSIAIYIDTDRFYALPITWAHIGRLRSATPIKYTNLRALLTSHKYRVMQTLLKAVQRPDDCYTYADELPYVILGLRRCGINWPELDIIERAVNPNNTALHESVDTAMDFNLGEFFLNINTDEYVEAVLFLSNLANSQLPNTAIHKIRRLHTEIVTALLYYLKTDIQNPDQKENVGDAITALRKIGIDWPEITIIERSMAVSSKHG